MSGFRDSFVVSIQMGTHFVPVRQRVIITEDAGKPKQLRKAEKTLVRMRCGSCGSIQSVEPSAGVMRCGACGSNRLMDMQEITPAPTIEEMLERRRDYLSVFKRAFSGGVGTSSSGPR